MLASAGIAGPSFDFLYDVRQLLAYSFMVNAFEAGTIVAITVSVVGWFVVLRRQTFLAHTLAVIAFPGAAAASVVGVPILFGYFTSCSLGALGLSTTLRSATRTYGEETAAIGITQALALALGFVFVSLAGGVVTSIDSLLFGTFLGISETQVLVLFILALAVAALVALAGRPLLFASVDGEIAQARGVPRPMLEVAFVIALGLAVAATSQITGALLVFALLVTPAATAQVLTHRPALSLACAVIIALAVTWLGLAFAYFTSYPIGFYVTSLSFGLYVAARLGRGLARRRASGPSGERRWQGAEAVS